MGSGVGSSDADVVEASGVAQGDAAGVVDTVAADPVARLRPRQSEVKAAAWSSTQTVLPFTGLDRPYGVAVDSTGAVYVADGYDRVLKLAAGSSTQTVLPFTGLDRPYGVAVDTAGNLYVCDFNNRVLKLAAGSSTPTVLPFTGFDRPFGLAVDTAGNLYVTDAANGRVVKLQAG